MPNDNEVHPDDLDTPSRSQRKRELLELQQTGKALAELSPKLRAKLDLEPTLARALEEYQRIKVPNALKRQMQFIGKLLQKTDVEAITQQIEQLELQSRRKKKLTPEIELWCDSILEDTQHLDRFMALFPRANRQTLRNLVRNASKNLDEKQGSDKRKLSVYIKEVISESISANP